MELYLGFFASHNGSNVETILENIESGLLNAKARIIISNNPDAKVLKIAKNKNISNYCLNSKNFPERFDSLEEAILEKLKENDVNLIVLAGYMKKIGEKIINEYKNRILNIHPALLPKYGGKGMYGGHVHEAVLKSGDKETGVTVHLVNSGYDKGKNIAQFKLPVYKNDSVESLSERVLKLEHILYTKVLIDIQTNKINLDEL